MEYYSRLHALYITQKTSSYTTYRGKNTNEEEKNSAFVGWNSKVITVLYLSKIYITKGYVRLSLSIMGFILVNEVNLIFSSETSKTEGCNTVTPNEVLLMFKDNKKTCGLLKTALTSPYP